ncbi:class I SAM-dependent methyltransferase [Haloarchaeobius iranensis]|uniref:Methyltransferase domain-containing protein n=1 Tax=Haloarchaeobius iranensis TaxID=996166 RepID=A0A1G9ZBE7_9EURY|nr:class I SAM-dependent methyltransferase [Haloarchaeobius iranensis]SDN18624.1 Methyltransferase domain-containing protein [Haloarchaeobius iranensis]
MSESIPSRSTDREREHSSTPGTDTKHTTSDTERPMSLREIQAAYAEYADAFERFAVVGRAVTGRYRRRQFADAEGRVLDVACGTGTNFRYLPEHVDLVAVDISPEMLSKARETLAGLPVDGDLQRMDAASLSFDDDSFDTVVSALSTCTFPDPVAALREMERVCEPDGRILLVEHGLSDFGPLARYQRWRADAHYEKAGCRWTQEPLAVVEEAGLQVENARTGLLGMVTSIECRPRRATAEPER